MLGFALGRPPDEEEDVADVTVDDAAPAYLFPWRVVLPLLGLGPLIAAVGVFGGFGTLYGLHRVNNRRRRRQFLQAPLPRAYLR